jgi:hypothetical protein
VIARRILILGASYGSLLGMKLILAGHRVTVICRQPTADSINRDGLRVRLPLSERTEAIELDSRTAPGRLDAAAPAGVNAGDYNLVALAMQEPQYRAPGVRELLEAVARSRVPCMSIMNMPPPPYLERIGGIDTEALSSCYTDASVWKSFDSSRMTLCSPDPQALRLPGESVNTLEVTLATNFKAARFGREEDTAMLRQLQADIEGIRFGSQRVELPVKLKVRDSLFVPLAKWSMLVTGNYRCVGKVAAISIREAVYDDIEASRSIYGWVSELCVRLGGSPDDLVPFEKYAAAAHELVRPSSGARALFAGATDIERVDRLVQAVAAQKDMRSPVLDEVVALVDERLELNREHAAVR